MRPFAEMSFGLRFRVGRWITLDVGEVLELME